MLNITNTQAIRPQRTARKTDVLSWMLRMDAAYRQSQQLKRATGEQLDDMGISREKANGFFLTRFRDNRWTPRG